MGSMLALHRDKKLEYRLFFFKPSPPVLIEEKTLMSTSSITVEYIQNTSTPSTTEEIEVFTEN